MRLVVEISLKIVLKALVYITHKILTTRFVKFKVVYKILTTALSCFIRQHPTNRAPRIMVCKMLGNMIFVISDLLQLIPNFGR